MFANNFYRLSAPSPDTIRIFSLCHFPSADSLVCDAIRHKKELIETNDLLAANSRRIRSLRTAFSRSRRSPNISTANDLLCETYKLQFIDAVHTFISFMHNN